jgi:glycosyltransferase involved in cell wall biosynthesis
MRKFVIGLDHGGGDHPLIGHTREIGRIFDLFHAHSQFTANSFKDVDGRVEVIPGPVDTIYYKPDPGLKRDKNLVVALGRILPHKGVDRIIQAMPNSLRLVIMGSGYDKDYFAYLKRLVGRSSSIQFKTQFTDEEVRTMLQTAGLFVHASTHVDYRGTYYAKPELLGLAPLEALSCGTPTLVSSAGALPELSALAGCQVFLNDRELVALLEAFSQGSLEHPASESIHQAVEEIFGLEAFGVRFMRVLQAARAGV